MMYDTGNLNRQGKKNTVMDQSDLHPSFKTGSILDGTWMLIGLIGKGGMGEVYRAHQLNLNRDVAIKIISEELLQSFEDNPEEKAVAFDRVQREVQTMAQVKHANILQIFDYGSIQVRKQDQAMPVQYIVMEYVPGNTLRFTMSDDGFADDIDLLGSWLTKYFLPVLDGVTAIHQNNIVHRDLKPENVLLDGETPKITDFGLARSVRMRAISNSWDVKGTMLYMAPEQFMDFRKAGPQADIYALGKILYEAVEGKIETKTIPLKAVELTETTQPLLQKIDVIVQKATIEDPAKRYQTVREFRLAITDALKIPGSKDGIKSDASPQKKHAGAKLWTRVRVGMTAVLIAMLAMTVWYLLENPGIVSRLDEKSPTFETVKKATTPSAERPAMVTQALEPEIRGQDGRAMVLIKPVGAQSSEIGPTVPFYLDRTKVTNHHYLEFLNEVKDRVTVSEGIVRSRDEIWVYLGTGVEPHEQIFYEHGRFHLRETAYASKPVVRVTYYGARAYATYYGKRLPAVAEWRGAAAWLKKRLPESISTLGTEATRQNQDEHMHMTRQTDDRTSDPAMQAEKAAQAEIDMPLVDFGMQFKEWVSENINSASSFQVHVAGWKSVTKDGAPAVRYPWEGFEDVGFRTILPLKP
jgi:serine/threonine-protein kinase